MFLRSQILLSLCLIGLTPLGWGQQQDAHRISKTFAVNNKVVPASLVQIDNRIYVALEDVAEALNGSVTSDARALNLNVPVSEKTSSQVADVPPSVATGSIKGTFTFYFNKNYGSRPDTGAEVWVAREEGLEIPETSYWFRESDANSFHFTSPLDKKSKHITALAHAVADGNGSITIPNLPAGKYTLVLKSSHARAPNGRDMEGRILTKPLTIAAGQVVDVSVDFGGSSF